MSTSIPDDGYQIPADNPTGLAWWQYVLSNLHGRLVDLKAEVAVTIEGLGDDATALALQLVQTSLAPTLATLLGQMTAIQEAIALAEDQLAALQSGGVLAVNVPVSLTGLTATNMRDAVGELLTRIAAEAEARAAAIAAVDTRTQRFVGLTANAALVAGNGYVIRTAGITLTLPAAPATGDTIRIEDAGVLGPASTATLARNGKTIMALGQDLILDVAGAQITVWYDGTTWRLR